MKRKMDKNKLKEIIREIVDKVLAENTPAKEPKEKEKETPVVAPGKPGEKTKNPIRRNPGNPNIPKKSPTPAKATKTAELNEEEMLNKIVARFKSKK
jgi:hypothetical protein